MVAGFFSETLRLDHYEFVSEGMFDVMAFEVELASLEVSRAMSFGSRGEDIARGVLPLGKDRFVVVGSYGSPWGPTPEPGLDPTFRALRFSGGGVLEAVGDADGFVAEVDWEGRSRWQARFADEGFDVVKSIARYDDGYVVGATNQRGAPPPGVSGLASDVPLTGFVASIGIDGSERWRWADPHLASPHAVVPAADGHVLVAGHHRPGLEVAGTQWDTVGDLDAMLVRLAPGGVPVDGWHCGGPGLDSPTPLPSARMAPRSSAGRRIRARRVPGQQAQRAASWLECPATPQTGASDRNGNAVGSVAETPH